MALRADDVDLNRDRLLVEAWQAGDASAFDDLYRLYFDRLRSYCQRRVGDPADAEELAQEAFSKALQALPRFAGDRRFYPWMTVIASRLCVDHHRRRSRIEPAAEIDLGAVEDDTVERLGLQADLLDLNTAIARLGPRHREVLNLREQDGLTYHEIADRLGVRHSAVETLLFRARRALRREFMAVSGSRLAAIPGLGWLALRVGRVRDRVSLAAPQFGQIGGTLAAGAVTAVLVAAPTAHVPAPMTVTTRPAAAAAAPASHEAPVGPDVPAPVTAPATSDSDAPPPPPAAPRVQPMTGEEARDKAGDMTLQLDLGDTGVAVDPAPLTEQAATPRRTVP